jgi:hypothetical protein
MKPQGLMPVATSAAVLAELLFETYRIQGKRGFRVLPTRIPGKRRG